MVEEEYESEGMTGIGVRGNRRSRTWFCSASVSASVSVWVRWELVETERALDWLTTELLDALRTRPSTPASVDDSDTLEVALTVRDRGVARVRGRASVAGVWCARGRRGVCGVRAGVGTGLGGLGADALRVRD